MWPWEHTERGAKPLAQLTNEAKVISSEAMFAFGKVATPLNDFCTELRNITAQVACLLSFPLQGTAAQPPMAAELCKWVRGRERCCFPSPALAPVRGKDYFLFRDLTSHASSHWCIIPCLCSLHSQRPVRGDGKGIKMHINRILVLFGLESPSLHDISAFSPKVAIPIGVYTKEDIAPVVAMQRLLS